MRKRNRLQFTLWHWSGVTPYTSSCELAGSCVFDKQSPEKLSLRPRLRGAGLIPKLRPLFCRVPWGSLTRSPCSTRADYLCRFTVRFLSVYACLSADKLRGFSRKFALRNTPWRTAGFSLYLRSQARSPSLPDLPKKPSLHSKRTSNCTLRILNFVTPSQRKRVTEY